jgi:metal-dependent amidase/aminoacylase/carboxypeptidase family protein
MRRAVGWLLGLGFAVAVSSASTAAPKDDDGWIDGHLDELVKLYQDLHSHPELSYKEVNTHKHIADELRKAGADVTDGVGKTGVVGVM